MTERQRKYQNACNDYLKAFCKKHGYDFADARESWVAGEVGTITCVADYFVSMEDIRTDIDHNAPEEEFVRWYDYTLRLHTLGATAMNYKHWLMGAPRKTEAEIAYLEARHQKVLDVERRAVEARQALEDAIKQGDY